MPELRHPGPARVFRRPTLRARMTLLYGAVICASGVALLGVTQLLAPGLLLHGVQKTGPGLPGAVMPRPPTRVPLTVGPSAFWSIVVAFAIMAVLSVAAGWLIAGRFVRPLRAIITTAHDISASNLHRRLGVRGRGDEFTELGQTLDDLFGRLEASFQAQRHFIANASHELRTPLTAGRALLQVALADPEPTVETLRATCEELVELGGQQERLISALLALASSQRGIGQLDYLDLADIAGDALLARQEEARHYGIHLCAALAAAPVTGDPSLTESLVTNLLDNAIRHNHPGGQVEISTALTTAGAVVSVSNTGALVPPDAVQDLFQPFRQLGTQRTRRGQGHGLGLAIVRAIADAHGAALTARPRPQGGLDIEVTFPDLRCPAGQGPRRDSAAHEKCRASDGRKDRERESDPRDGAPSAAASQPGSVSLGSRH
jgi:signal transduction histidine kinase